MVSTLNLHKKVINGFDGLLDFDISIYYDVLDNKFFNQLKKYINNQLLMSERKTYLTHGTKFSLDNKNIKVISHSQNDREQIVVYDMMYEKDYYYQTKDTIKKWSDNKIKNNVSFLFYKYIKAVENLEPFCNEKENWIFYRCHINYLAYEKSLALHTDSNPILYHDHQTARVKSLTFYLYDHIENMGGEFWTLDSDFVYKPKTNSILSIEGNKVIHGVTMNMNKEPRLAFTVRIAHKDDLYLPGHPNKWLYDVNNI